MPGYIQLASKPFPVEELQGPDFIPIVIVGIFLVLLIFGLFK